MKPHNLYFEFGSRAQCLKSKTKQGNQPSKPSNRLRAQEMEVIEPSKPAKRQRMEAMEKDQPSKPVRQRETKDTGRYQPPKPTRQRKAEDIMGNQLSNSAKAIASRSSGILDLVAEHEPDSETALDTGLHFPRRPGGKDFLEAKDEFLLRIYNERNPLTDYFDNRKCSFL
jgi:hypothetical protein